MKRLLLSAALLLAVCTLASAQRKTQFGVTVQAGNYLQAQQDHQASEYITNDYKMTGGVLMGLGVYAERALGKHLALYSGLNYAQSAFTQQFTTIYPDMEKRLAGSGTGKQTHQYTVYQVALPVQWQLRVGGQRQLAFSIGAAPTLTRTKVRSDPASPYTYNPYILICGDGMYYGPYDLENPSTRLQVLFSAGLHYRPDAKNALGLEFWLAPKEKEAEADLYSYGYGYYQHLYGKHPQMRSLQVSLRHSW